jgi:hypothetical protein
MKVAVLSVWGALSDESVALRSAATVKTLAMSGPTASKPLMLWCRDGHLHMNCPECNAAMALIQRHTEGACMRKEICKREEHNELPRDSLGGRSYQSLRHQSSPTQLHYIITLNTSIAHRSEKLAAHIAAAYATNGNAENRSGSTDSRFI